MKRPEPRYAVLLKVKRQRKLETSSKTFGKINLENFSIKIHCFHDLVG